MKFETSKTIAARERGRSTCVRMLAAVTVALALSACGGGGERDGDVYVARPFDIHVIAAGQLANGSYSPSGTVQRIWLKAGSDIEFDANEPVIWSLNVGGASVSGRGISVLYGDVSITVEEITNSRILISTATQYPLAAPLAISLVATSAQFYDQVARFELVLTP